MLPPTAELENLFLFNTSLAQPALKEPSSGTNFPLRSLTLDHSTIPLALLSTSCATLTSLVLEFSSPIDPDFQHHLLPNFHLVSSRLKRLGLSPATESILRERVEDLPELQHLSFSAMFSPMEVLRLLLYIPADRGFLKLESISLKWNLSFAGLIVGHAEGPEWDKAALTEILDTKFVVEKQLKEIGLDWTLTDWLAEDVEFSRAVEELEARKGRLCWLD